MADRRPTLGRGPARATLRLGESRERLLQVCRPLCFFRARTAADFVNPRRFLAEGAENFVNCGRTAGEYVRSLCERARGPKTLFHCPDIVRPNRSAADQSAFPMRA